MSISSPYAHFSHYLLAYCIGLGSVLLIRRFLNPEHLKNVALILWFIHVLMIIYLILFTKGIRGSKRWLFLFSKISYQPSEGLKLFYIVSFSKLLMEKKYLWLAVMFAVSIGLFALQPDLGNAFLLTVLTIILLLYYNTDPKFVIIGLSLAIPSGFIALKCFPHAQKRFGAFFNPDKKSDPRSYQNLRALAAIKAGRVVGVGPGKGSVKKVLPDAYSDFIFAVIGEELGLIGCALTCLSFLFFFLQCAYYFHNLMLCSESLIVIGIGALISLQAWIHMASAVWIIPTKGTSLPFISHGGTSTIIMYLGVGILFNSVRAAHKRKVLGYILE